MKGGEVMKGGEAMKGGEVAKVRKTRKKEKDPARYTVEVKCGQCPKTFMATPWGAKRAKFCSPTCRSQNYWKQKEARGEIFRWNSPRRTPEERERDLASLSPEDRKLLDKFLAEDKAFVVETLGAGAEDAQAIAQHESARHLLLAEGVMDESEVLMDGVVRLLHWYNELLTATVTDKKGFARLSAR